MRKNWKIIFCSVLAVLAVVLSSFICITDDDSDASGNPMEGYIGYGINALSYDDMKLKESMTRNTRIFSNQIDSLVRVDTDVYSKQFLDSFTEHNTYSKTYNNIYGVGGMVEVNLGAAYIGVRDTVEVGFALTNASSSIYEIVAKEWDIRTKSIYLTDTNSMLLSKMLSAEFMKDLDSLASMGEMVDESDFKEFFEKYGTHVNTGYYLGGKSKTTRIYTAESTEVTNADSLKNTLHIYVGEGMKNISYVEVGVSYSWESAESETVGNVIIRENISSCTIGGIMPTNLGSIEGDHAWAESVMRNEADSNALIGFMDGYVVPVWELLPQEYSSLSLEMERSFYKQLNQNYLDFCKEYEIKEEKKISSTVLQVIDDAIITSPVSGLTEASSGIITGEMTAGSKGQIFTTIAGFGYSPSCLIYEVTKGKNLLKNETVNPNGSFEIKNNVTGKIQMFVSCEGIGMTMQSNPITIDVVSVTNTDFGGGNGTERNPFLIYNYEQLYAVHSTVGMEYYYKLMNDIDCGRQSWIPFGDRGSGEFESFRGHFNGNDYTLYNVRISGNMRICDGGSFAGLFANIAQGASVSNLTLNDVEYVLKSNCMLNNLSKFYVGGIAGGSAGLINDCCVSGVVNVVGDDCPTNIVGGICGVTTGTIKCCSFNGLVNATGMTSEVGGIVGEMISGIISNVIATGPVSAHCWYKLYPATPEADCGGIVGMSVTGSIRCAIFDGPLSSSGSLAPAYGGGIIGQRFGYSTVQNCVFKSNVGSSIGYNFWGKNESDVATLRAVDSWNKNNFSSLYWDRHIWCFSSDISNPPSLTKATAIQKDMIDLEELGYNTEYLSGDTFNPLKLDGSIGRIPILDSSLNINYDYPDYIKVKGIDGGMAVTFYYKKCSPVTLEIPFTDKRLVSIQIKEYPDSTVFDSVDKISFDGLIIEGKYNDGSFSELSIDDLSISYKKMAGFQTVTIKSKESTKLSVDMQICVKDQVDDSPMLFMSVSGTQPYKLVYSVKEGDVAKDVTYYKQVKIAPGTKLVFDFDKISCDPFCKFNSWFINGEIYKTPVVSITTYGNTSVVLVVDSPKEYEEGMFDFAEVIDSFDIIEEDGITFSKNVFNRLSDGRSFNVTLYDGPDSYTWSFNKSNEAVIDIKLNASVMDVSKSDLREQFMKKFGSAKGQLIDFEMNGTLPAGTKFITELTVTDDNLSLYRYDSASGTWNRVSGLSINEDEVSLELNHCSSYVITHDPNVINVTLSAGEGSVSPNRIIVHYGERYGDLPTPTLEGFSFQGWSTDGTNYKRVFGSDLVKIDHDHTLYAMWEPASTPGSESEDKGGFCFFDVIGLLILLPVAAVLPLVQVFRH